MIPAGVIPGARGVRHARVASRIAAVTAGANPMSGIDSYVIEFDDGETQTHEGPWSEARELADRAGLEHRQEVPLGETGWFRTGLTLIVAVVALLAACGPPPPPTPLPGKLSHFTRQRLLVGIVDSQGHTFRCELYLDATWDLGYSTVYVTSHTYVPSGSLCASSDWTLKRATPRCDMGTNVSGCGSGLDWDALVWTGPLNERRRAFFDIVPPHTGIIRITFSATLVFPSGLQFPVKTTGSTPQIRCDSAEKVCKFQA